MKICLVSDNLVGYHKTWSGAEMVVKILSQELKKEGQSIVFLTTKFGRNQSQEEIYQLPTFINNPQFLKKFTAPFYLAIGFFSALYYLWKTKPDVVHLFHTNYLFSPVMIGAKLLGLPTVFTFLDYYLICPRATFRFADGRICDDSTGRNCRQCISFFKSLERLIIKWLSLKLDAVITFTATSKQRLLRHGFPENKIKIIYTYNIPQEFSSKSKKISFKSKEAKDNNVLFRRQESPNQTCLFIGSFHDHKGVKVVLSAMAEVLKAIPEAKLNIIGFGNDFDKQEVDKLIDNLRIKNSINFLGQRSNEEVLDLILDNALVVAAEQWPSEFGPLALVEAMALGRPVVSGNLGSPPDFIKNGENGFLVDYNQPSQYAEKIIWLLLNKKAAETMGKRAKAAGQILFSYDQGKAHLDLYQRLT